ncbi:MAG: hypothetical protein PHE41_05690 [Eubacteriales bacterium]|nr:hypothetical protein [Eubacteriales bacterium]
MKKIMIIILAVAVLAGGGIYLKSQSSYSEYERMQADKNSTEGTSIESKGPEEKLEVEDDRTPEDIALDKKLNEEWKKNEKSWCEYGRAGSAFRPTIEEPHFSRDDLLSIITTTEKYMKENPERFPEPGAYARRTTDPRITNLLYGEEKKGIIEGFDDENLVAWDVENLDGGYNIILLGRNSKDDKWQVLSEGDVYKLRKEMVEFE